MDQIAQKIGYVIWTIINDNTNTCFFIGFFMNNRKGVYIRFDFLLDILPLWTVAFLGHGFSLLQKIMRLRILDTYYSRRSPTVHIRLAYVSNIKYHHYIFFVSLQSVLSAIKIFAS